MAIIGMEAVRFFGLQLFGNREAVHVRHGQIKQDEVGCVGSGGGNPVNPTRSLDDVVPSPLENPGGQVAVRVHVVDDQSLGQR
jgi:hypothetical protein